MVEELLIEIGKLAPVVGVLVYMVFWFNTQFKKKEDEISSLNVALRETEKGNLDILYKVLKFMERLDEKDLINFTALLKEISEMRKSIEDKIDKL